MKQCLVDFISKRLFLLGQNQILVISRCYILMAFLCLFLSWGYSQGNEELQKLNVQVVKLYQEGRYQEGIALAEKVYEKSLSVLGEKHPHTLSFMSNLAELYRSQGKYDKTEPLLVKTLQLQRETLGEKHPSTLVSMNNLAKLYESQGEHKKAEPIYVRTLQLRKEILGKRHFDTLLSMNNLAALYRSQGKYSKAELLFTNTLVLMREVLGEKHPSTLVLMNNLAELYSSQGEYSKAEPLFVNILKLRRKILGEKHLSTLISMENLSGLYHSQGEYKKAEPLLVNTLKLRRKILGEKHPSTLNSMNNLAGLYDSQGKYKKAELFFLNTLKLRREVLGEKHPSTLNSMSNLALLYSSQREYKKAESLFVNALKLRREILGKRNPFTLISMNNLGTLYRSQGKYKKAEPLFVNTLKLRKEILGEKHPFTLSSMNNLIFLYRLQEEYGRGLSIFKEYLVKKCLFLKREFRGNSEKTRLSMLEQFNITFDKNNLFSILEEYPKEDFAHLAFYFSLNYKGILLQISRELKQVFRDSADQELVKELLRKRSLYSNLFLDYERREENKVLEEKLEKEINDLEKKLIWKNSDFQELISDVKVDEIRESLSQDELLIDFVVYKSVIVDKSELKLAAVVVDKKFIKLVNLGNFADLVHLIQNCRKKIQKKEEFREISQRIYTRIFSPLEKHQEGKNKVYIVPDGILHLLPFRSLLDLNGEYLLQSKNIVILSSSRDFITKKTKKSNSPVAIFAYPDYGEEDGKEIVEGKKVWFYPLKGTLKEAQDIQDILNAPTKVYIQDQATEENISLLDSPPILHIATHGYFLDDGEDSRLEKKNRGALFIQEVSPIEPSLNGNSDRKLINPLVYSGLALSRANERGDDGILTALEVLGLNLLGTDLVVLSACDTGVGEVRQGEGVYSLQRAFREAGAKSVLATLWKVDDQATQIFMKKFYQRYIRGDSPQKAVRDTQLEFLKSKRYSHSFYWSSFVMIGGSSDDLEQKNRVVLEEKEQGSIIPFILLGLIILIIAFLILAHKKKEKRLLGERIAKRRKRQERVK